MSESSPPGAPTHGVVPQVRIPPGVPVLVADVVLDVVYAPFTCKVVFGLEIGPQNYQPTAVVQIATPHLLHAARLMLETAASPAHVAHARVQFDRALAEMAGGTASKP